MNTVYLKVVTNEPAGDYRLLECADIMGEHDASFIFEVLEKSDIVLMKCFVDKVAYSIMPRIKSVKQVGYMFIIEAQIDKKSSEGCKKAFEQVPAMLTLDPMRCVFTKYRTRIRDVHESVGMPLTEQTRP